MSHLTRRMILAATALVALLTATAQAAVNGRYIFLGNALSESMELAEFQVFSGGENVILHHPEVFNRGLEYAWYMLKRTPEHLKGDAEKLVDGKLDPAQRVSFGSKVGGGYLDIALYNTSLELDLGKEIPIDAVAFMRSRYTSKVHGDLGWRILVVLDAQRRIVASEAFNVYDKGWKTNGGVWRFDLQPATGPWAGKVIPAGQRCWLSEAEYIRDFLHKPVVDLVKEMTPADEARLERFQHRNDKAAIEALGERFFHLVNLHAPGLDEVRKLVEARKYATALEAFKQPCIDRLAPFKEWNAGEGTSIYANYSWDVEPDTRSFLRSRDLHNHLFADRQELAAKRFVPGLLPPAKLEFPFQMRPLLLNYVVSGNRDDLQLWEAMTDDWAMGFQDAADKEPQKLRDYFVLEQNLMGNLKDLYMASQSRPQFVQELSGATLARYLMPILEEVPVASWRVMRTCTFNHTFNGIPEGLFISAMLDEFYAGQRWNREMQQAFVRLYTLSMYRDGSMVEVGDEGHYLATVISPSNIYGYYVHKGRPAWFTPAIETYFLDHYRVNTLSHARNLAPNGANVRWNPENDTVMGFDYELNFKDPYWRNVTDMRMAWGDYYPKLTLPVLTQPLPRALIDTVYGRGRPPFVSRNKKQQQEQLLTVFPGDYQGPPKLLSDWMPYTGLWYFRGGWGHDDAFLHMVKPPIANNLGHGWDQLSQRYGAISFPTTSYRFYDYASPLFTGQAVWIDDQPPCPEEKLVPCGSKQGNFTRAVEKPQPSRWYTDAALDFGEAIYKGNYRIALMQWNNKTREHYLDLSKNPVNGVTTTRQIIQVRPARLFLQVDRMRYATAGETHTNAVHNLMYLPDTDKGDEPSDDELKLMPEQRRVETVPPTNAGVTVAWFGQPELKVALDARDQHHPAGKKMGGPSITFNGYHKILAKEVIATWPGTGESVLISLLSGHKPGDEPLTATADLSTDTGAGVRATTANGVTVSLLIARHLPAELTLGRVTVSGEALLLVQAPNAAPTGLALGVKSLTLDGKRQAAGDADFAFTLPDGGQLATAPVLRPVDPPSIGPDVDTFIDSAAVTLTSTTPGAVITYTTDGSDPTFASTHYTGPITIAADTFIKARAFRPGATTLPDTAAGTEVSAISYATFRKQAALPAVAAVPASLQAGLNYDYLEASWFALWTYTDQLAPKAVGTTAALLDVSMRQTDDPFGVRYHGYITIPTEGVYTFHAPSEYIDHTCTPGYDVCLFIDGKQWSLGQMWHGRGEWSVALAKGLHHFRVTFADARAKDLEHQRVDLWGHYPYAQTTWKGVAPVIEMSGPGLSRQPIPNAWLTCEK